ncbi:hypothetical protein [Sinosporangium siamense]|uniref:Uncharacterized protein n=1 Tax=Sinosporangium siamense TaxID=1367973 RepID=A0A919V5R4_9ACTN|nr:hypothetical protein [Sinosporangium siamense]GII91171.1 hypothetical protein Ssi02_14020 [Sinosporangium siamense]
MTQADDPPQPAPSTTPPAKTRRVGAWAAAHPWHLALAGVAACSTLISLLLTSRLGLGWDESVYISQVARGVPSTHFSAPRARGVPLLVSPVAAFTSSPLAIRIYLSVISGLGLFLAYWIWLRLRPGPGVPLAAAMFAGFWVSMFYANAAMPNTWVAYCGVAGIGLWCLAERPAVPLGGARGSHRERLNLMGLVAVFAAASLLRPTDASWLALPLLAYGLLGRRTRATAAVAAGLSIGWAEWITEAFLTYGGPVARLKAAGTQNMTGLTFSLPDHLRALNGPLLCRFGLNCGDVPLEHLAWFAALPVLAALGVWATRRREFVLALAAGLSLAFSYFFTVGYAAPRFLLPAYALLALPVAAGLKVLWRGRWRAVRVFTAVGLGCYFALQGASLVVYVAHTHADRIPNARVATALRALGLRSPCFLYGHHAVQIGYLARCSSLGVVNHYGGAEVPAALRAAMAAGAWVGVITTASTLPAPFLTSWTPVSLPVAAEEKWRVFLPPRP